MSNTKTIRLGANEYDFNRCTKKQLVAYLSDWAIKSPNLREESSAFLSGIELLDAARVERKEDVARELAELCAKTFDHNIRAYDCLLGTDEANKFRVLAGRYNKAVG